MSNTDEETIHAGRNDSLEVWCGMQVNAYTFMDAMTDWDPSRVTCEACLTAINEFGYKALQARCDIESERERKNRVPDVIHIEYTGKPLVWSVVVYESLGGSWWCSAKHNGCTIAEAIANFRKACELQTQMTTTHTRYNHNTR